MPGAGGLGLGRVRRGRARLDRQREGRAPVRVASRPQDVRAARLDAQRVGARLEGRVRDVVLAVADVLDAARRRGPRMSTAIWSAEWVLVGGLISLLPVASLVVTRKVCFTPLTAAVRAAPVAVVAAEVRRGPRADRRRESFEEPGDVGRVVERRGLDRLVDDGVAGPGEAHARRAVSSRSRATRSWKACPFSGTSARWPSDAKVAFSQPSMTVVRDVDARAVVEEDVERVRVRRAATTLPRAAPDGVTVVGRHGAVAPVEVDLGVHAHDRRVALQPGVVEAHRRDGGRC